MKQKKGYWENTIDKALRNGKFSKTAKENAIKWNRCSVGERLNFPITKTIGRHFEFEPDDEFLDSIGTSFADVVDSNDAITAKMIHNVIQTYNESKPEYAIHYLYTSGLMDRYQNILSKNSGDDFYYLKLAIRIAEQRHETYQKIQEALGQTNSSN